MDATFRLRRSHRNLALWCLPGFLAWAALSFFTVLTDVDVDRRIEAMAFLAGIPLFMAGLSLWLLLACWREELTFRSERLLYRGLFRRREFELSEVTSARWRIWPIGGSVVLQTPSTRLPLDFHNYEPEAYERIILHLRSSLRPDVQTGWNLFAYKHAIGKRIEGRREPGSGDILLTRRRWNRYFIPLFVVMTIIGIAEWWLNGDWSLLAAAPPIILAGWVLIRYTTPAEGMIDKKISVMFRGVDGRFLRFLALWGLVGISSIVADSSLRRGSEEADEFTAIGMVIWFAVLLTVVFRESIHMNRRDREAAELAAKAHTE